MLPPYHKPKPTLQKKTGNVSMAYSLLRLQTSVLINPRPRTQRASLIASTQQHYMASTGPEGMPVSRQCMQGSLHWRVGGAAGVAYRGDEDGGDTMGQQDQSLPG